MNNSPRNSNGVMILTVFIFLLTLWCSPLSAQFAETVPIPDAVIGPDLVNTAPEDRVSLDFKSANLETVLQSLSHSYKLNLVLAQDVKGKVSMSLRDVSIDEALTAVLSINGYTFTRKGNLIYITQGPGLEGIDMRTETLPLKYLSAAEASTLIEKTLSSKGDIRANVSTNSLVVTDFPSFLEKARNVLTKIDQPPIQVLIEAKLVDITEKEFQNLGLSYTYDYQPDGKPDGLFNRKSFAQEKLIGSQSLAGPSSTLSGGQMKITDFTIKGFAGTVTIDALIQDQKAHLLASPSILTLNGKEGRIIIGERFPYKEKTQTTTGTTETTKFVDIGTALRVTPWVSPDGWITMYVHPEVSSLTSSLDAGPRVATREADATIRVRDGDTIIIGGLIKRQDDHTKGKVPFLNKIPIIGPLLFSNRSSDMTSTELVVFITPHIIKHEETLPDATQQAYINIKTSGERAGINQVWNEALSLESGKGIVSQRKDKETRMGEAFDLYKQITAYFPESEKADDALWRAGHVAYHYFNDWDLTTDLLLQLKMNYPDSPFTRKAARLLKKINKKSKKQAKKLSKKKRSDIPKVMTAVYTPAPAAIYAPDPAVTAIPAPVAVYAPDPIEKEPVPSPIMEPMGPIGPVDALESLKVPEPIPVEIEEPINTFQPPPGRRVPTAGNAGNFRRGNSNASFHLQGP